MSYVYNSWCRASYSHLTAAHYLSNQGPPPAYSIYRILFDDVQRCIVANSNVSIAINEDDADQILGFAIVAQGPEMPILHYVQVKKELWRNGVASTLLAAANISKAKPCIYTFSSPFLGKWKSPSMWRHIPHYLLEKS